MLGVQPSQQWGAIAEQRYLFFSQASTDPFHCNLQHEETCHLKV